ncbi:hypothetical protein I317_07588 [Kwoniella heveanensis CBS 569]|uniref:Uncharacterized protein n=1 Tax=Kwoniella heveanensis BCC8398 TaxID=1296120 RepID=A0A1B9GI53_9TREE|nr:hypothetical protein I316_07660 [Kwoniella heveanensis BCC8398]OCF38640.1 hypothetical protein I317_07588 [Kwoniella heveanensis CBS 569]
MAPVGTQSPSQEKPDPLVGGNQLTQAEQRPEASGADAKKVPGEGSGGVSAEALKVAQESAQNVQGEQGQSRKDVETGSA